MNMKLRLEACRYLIAASIICGAFAIAPYGPTGCTSVNPPTLSVAATDQIILRAEQTAQTAKLTFNTFLHLERDNEALLANVPGVHAWAENIRKNGINWIVSLRNVTKTFKASRTPENQANLNTALLSLTDAVNQTNKYISEAKKVSQP